MWQKKFMSDYLLSVVIPTHNRANYAFDSISSLLGLDSKRLEVVVSDTSESDDLKIRLELLGANEYGPKLNYFKPRESLDMTGNHNAALAAATGKYVCLIGDDDTVTHELIDAADWADKNNIDCLSPNILSNYAWPDFRSLNFGSGHASRLYLPKHIGSLSCIEGASALSHALANAGQGTEGLPKLYHGLVKRELLDEVKALSGNYFHGSSPDVSMAVALSYLLANRQSFFYTINYPLTIPGASGGSNTGRSAMNKHKGRLSSEKQTNSFIKAGWPDSVPKFFSVETVWAHACISTLIALAATDCIDKYNYPRLFGACLNFHPEFLVEINNAIEEVASERKITVKEINSHIREARVTMWIRRAFYLTRRVLWPTASGGRSYVTGIKTVSEAQPILQAWLNERDLSFRKVIQRNSK